ncbi:hypothetical protein [Streptomyces thermocarboxydovorans]
MAPPPPQASARLPDSPPTVGRGLRATAVPRQPHHRPGTGDADTIDRTSPAPKPEPPSAPPRPAASAYPLPDPALSWSATSPAPAGVTGEVPVRQASQTTQTTQTSSMWPRRATARGQAVAAAVCLVLGIGLIGGAVTGSYLSGDSEEAGRRTGFAAGRDLWHSVPVDQLFPPVVKGTGAGPGEADRIWTRIAVAPDSGCKDAFDPLLRKVLAPVGCERLLRATYTDATQSHVTTVGLLFTKADPAGMTVLARRFERERLDRRTDLMPLPYAAKGTAAEDFGKQQRAAWAISVLTDAPVVVYAVSGWADGRAVDDPQPAADALESGATTAPAQSGLGHEARGLADRAERGLRKAVGNDDDTANREHAS